MTKLHNQILVSILVAVFVTACGATTAPTPSPAAAPTVAPPTVAPTVAPPTVAPTMAPPSESSSTDTPVPPTAPAVSTTPQEGADQVVGTVVRFSRGSASVDVTIGEDNPAVRDFLSMLPLTLTVEEFVGREKISYLPRKLAHAGSPGSDPEDGDLIYYTPWGNLGFYYNTAGIGYTDQTIHLGTYQASLEQLHQLEGQDVSVEVVR